jgi:hypothetical protein
MTMIKETVNGLERILTFRPAYHKVHEDPKKDYGVHGVEMWFVIKGPKGAVHFGMYTNMMLKKTRDWWEATGRGQGSMGLFPMGVDVGYHSPTPMHDFQKEDGPYWPKKLKHKVENMPYPGKDATPEEMTAYLDNNYWEKIGDAPPNCEWLGVPCYCDGSALAAEEPTNMFLEEGDEPIWKMLEERYHSQFD